MDAARPWYRHPWPWILMAGPSIVVVAGIATAVLAVRTDDGVVAEDYYKQGLAINRTLEREHRAADLGVGAALQFNEETTRVRATLALHGPQPKLLTLSLVHPTRAGEDQRLALSPVAPGVFEGTLTPPKPANWTLQLEDGAATWRLEGEWRTGAPRVSLGAMDH